MDYSTKWFLALLISCLLVNSGCKENFTNPVPEHLINLVKNSAFEINGKPSFDGWLLFIDSADIHLSCDRPIGKWGESVLMKSYYSGPSQVISQDIPVPSGRHVYRLSFWAKSVPPIPPPLNIYASWVTVLLKVNESAIAYPFGILGICSSLDSNWTYYSRVTDTLDATYPGANVVFRLFMLGAFPESPGKQYYNDPRLEILY